AYYGQDVAGKVLTAVVGFVALGCYAGFALALCASVTRARCGLSAAVWRAVAAAAAVVGPLLALAAVGLRTWLATAVDSMPAADAVSVHQTVLGLRIAGGTCLGVVLLVLGSAGLREVLPRWFRIAAVTIGCWILVAALLVAATAGDSGYWLSFAGFT
nr:hypothetical protein [Micromonospora sp. DSM 115978]